MNIREYVETLNIPLGQSLRQDCPSCRNRNTFSVTNLNGTLLWKCFHANCNLRGKVNAGTSLEFLNNSNINTILHSTPLPRNWSIPSYFTYALLNDRATRYCNYWKISDPSLYYDPKRDRLVFPLYNHQKELKGATGRSLNRANQPRWLVYSRFNGCPFISPRRNRTYSNSSDNMALVVEDAISAMVASSMCNSIAILGTTINEDVIPYLIKYDKLFIALDDDATAKSLILQNKLKAFVDTKVIPLKKDIKYFSSSELEELRNHINGD